MSIFFLCRSQACRARPEVTFLDYADTAEVCFQDAGGVWARGARFMANLVNTFLILTQFGSNAVYVLFIAQNIQPVREDERIRRFISHKQAQ